MKRGLPNTSLTRITEFTDESSFNSFIEIGIFEDNEGGVSTEFHGYLLHCSRSEFGEHLSNSSTSSETDFLDDRIGGEFSSCLSVLCGDNMDTICRNTGLDSQFDKSQTRIWSRTRRFYHDGTSSCESRCNFPRNHG